MSARSKRGTILSRCGNPETGELEFYEMTPEEAEKAISHILQTLERLPSTKPVQLKTVEGETKRGAHHARRFLAENPTQEEIQRVWEWTWDETDMGCGCSACLANIKAYQKVLRPHLG
jgi:hypothetical protein